MVEQNKLAFSILNATSLKLNLQTFIYFQSFLKYLNSCQKLL